MKSISKIEVEEIFIRLLANRISRETASEWAMQLINLSEEKKLNYSPQDLEVSIWEAIQFLQGVDIKDAPNIYLHNEDDIKIALVMLQNNA
jgi:hypothetical protein